MNDPYVTHETWMICPSQCENYIDRTLPEDWELDGNAGKPPRLILAWR